MECPHLSSSVCIAPDSAKFPNGSPSSWCCSGAINSRTPMNSCATFWTTYTWNFRAVSTVFPARQFCRRILLCLQVTSVACKI
uniref:Ubiquitin specific peptidase 3 n=3 Tax=Homininae TaxID=207598 RepID=A0A2I3TRP1_PANTR